MPPTLAADEGAKMAFDDTLTRRQLLKGAVVLGAASAVGGPVLAACGGGGETTEPSPTAAGAPKKGGHIMSGVSGGSAKDELDAHTAYRTVPQIAMQWQLYDALLGFDPEQKLINLLAESYEASDDAVVSARRGLQDVILGVKLEAKALYGPSSDQVAALGLKKKSEKAKKSKKAKVKKAEG